ncbi:unnamed protein product [Arabidopsis arenosa]|uniref:Reverse transcriptase zinc-binding domain-containing protein n=1 Tax=Arabidopsis arenosa TaxID=38785 RepID=A0A8S1ZJW5_ARAAE|nr:unnamed protein product [Arabidopsis arenosa]
MVSDLLNTRKTGWDTNRVNAWIHHEDVDKVLSIKICPGAEKDLLGWHYTKEGIYTVKSAYWLATHLPSEQQIRSTPGANDLKAQVWRINTAPKLKHFLWKLLSGALATKANLVYRHMSNQPLCCYCCSNVETTCHLFFDCVMAQAVWRGSGFPLASLTDPNISLEEKIKAIMTCNTSTRFSHLRHFPLWILWRLWISRNILCFQRRSTSWRKIIRQARDDAQEWQDQERHTEDMRGSRAHTPSETRSESRWEPPNQHWIKCNYDGTYSNGRISQAGWVIRNDRGTYLGAGQAKGNQTRNVVESEFQALIMAMQHCWIKGYNRQENGGQGLQRVNSHGVDVGTTSLQIF